MRDDSKKTVAVIAAVLVVCLVVLALLLVKVSFREIDEPYDTETNAGSTEGTHVDPTGGKTSTDDPGSQTKTDSPRTDVPVTSDVTKPPVTEPPATSGKTEAPPTEAPVTSGKTEAPSTSDSPGYVIIPESPAVDQSYFASDTLFIGDSLTVGLQLYSGLKTNYYCFVGMSTYNAFTQPFIERYGTQITLGDALATDNQWKRIYVQIGVNELYQDASSYIADYEKMINKILTYCPNAKIYVQSVFPITAEAAESRYSQYGGNTKIASFNQKLVELCSRRHFYYVNVYSQFADNSGALPSVYSGGDGVHLVPDSYKLWVKYLCTHTAK